MKNDLSIVIFYKGYFFIQDQEDFNKVKVCLPTLRLFNI